MNKRRLYYTILAAVIIIGIGVFYVQTQRQRNFAQTRELFAPIYAYSGKLTPEQQKEYADLADSLMNVSPDVAKKYRLPQREQLQLEAHTMTLYRDNPELLLMGPESFPAATDVKPYQRHFGILALIAKTKIADLPANSRKLMIKYLESLNSRLTRNSIEDYVEKISDIPLAPNPKLPPRAFGILSAGIVGADQWIMKADGASHFPEGGKHGVVHITDIYGKEYTIDRDSPVDTAMTENTTELYAKIDRLFEILTDEEFQRLSTISKTERTASIEMLFSSL